MTGATPAPPSLPPVSSTDTLRQALCKMMQAFEAAGIESAPVDARHLLQGVLQIDAAALIRDPDRQVGERCVAVSEAARRRLESEPVARILGARTFYGRQFRVTPDVLDPRADTETVIDLVLDIVRDAGRQDDRITIADIGVGSGAIIATLLAELPAAVGIGSDISAAAIAVARANAVALGVADRLTLVETSGLAGIAERLDIIVSNPPYIPSIAIAGLDVDVKNYDPHIALDGGPDGLRVYREIASDISGLAWPCWVVLEIGVGQAEAVEAIFEEIGAIARHRRADLGGHIRSVALEIHR